MQPDATLFNGWENDSYLTIFILKASFIDFKCLWHFALECHQVDNLEQVNWKSNPFIQRNFFVNSAAGNVTREQEARLGPFL